MGAGFQLPGSFSFFISKEEMLNTHIHTRLRERDGIFRKCFEVLRSNKK